MELDHIHGGYAARFMTFTIRVPLQQPNDSGACLQIHKIQVISEWTRDHRPPPDVACVGYMAD